MPFCGVDVGQPFATRVEGIGDGGGSAAGQLQDFATRLGLALHLLCEVAKVGNVVEGEGVDVWFAEFYGGCSYWRGMGISSQACLG